MRRYVWKWRTHRLACWATLRLGQTVALTLSVVPVVIICWRLTPYSKRGIWDLLPFVGAWLIERIAFHVGEWEGIFETATTSTRRI